MLLLIPNSRLNVRIGSALHMLAVEIATEEDVTVNDFIKRAVEHEVEKSRSDKEEGKTIFGGKQGPSLRS